MSYKFREKKNANILMQIFFKFKSIIKNHFSCWLWSIVYLDAHQNSFGSNLICKLTQNLRSVDPVIVMIL